MLSARECARKGQWRAPDEPVAAVARPAAPRPLGAVVVRQAVGRAGGVGGLQLAAGRAARDGEAGVRGRARVVGAQEVASDRDEDLVAVLVSGHLAAANEDVRPGKVEDVETCAAVGDVPARLLQHPVLRALCRVAREHLARVLAAAAVDAGAGADVLERGPHGDPLLVDVARVARLQVEPVRRAARGVHELPRLRGRRRVAGRDDGNVVEGRGAERRVGRSLHAHAARLRAPSVLVDGDRLLVGEHSERRRVHVRDVVAED